MEKISGVNKKKRMFNQIQQKIFNKQYGLIKELSLLIRNHKIGGVIFSKGVYRLLFRNPIH